MQLIPFITLKNHKIHPGPTSKTIPDTDLLNQIKTDTPIYFYDLDGITNDKPNLCLFQKLGTKISLWTDSGPRVLGDIVDTVMAGAHRITLRPPLWTLKTIENIQEITEQQLYIYQDTTNLTSPNTTADGLVFLNQSEKLKNHFKQESYLKTLSLKTPVYLYDPDKNNYSYWQKLGLTGILIDLEHYHEYLSHVH